MKNAQTKTKKIYLNKKDQGKVWTHSTQIHHSTSCEWKSNWLGKKGINASKSFQSIKNEQRITIFFSIWRSLWIDRIIIN